MRNVVISWIGDVVELEGDARNVKGKFLVDEWTYMRMRKDLPLNCKVTIRETGYCFVNAGSGSMPFANWIMNAMGSSVDHINRDPADNRSENLRLCTKMDNAQNHCGFGVRFSKRKKMYFAEAVIYGEKVRSPFVKTEEEAYKEYLRLKLQCGEFAPEEAKALEREEGS